MIDIKNPKVKKCIEGIHEGMLRKIRRGGQINEEIIKENRIFSILCNDIDLEPRRCAKIMNEKYGYDLSGNDVIQIFRNQKLSNRMERKEIFQWAEEISASFSLAVEGDQEGYKKLFNKGGIKHRTKERIAAIMIYEKHPEIDAFDDSDNLQHLGNALARYFFYDISDSIAMVYGFPLYRDAKKKTEDNKNQLTYEQALQRIDHLENMLERTNTMLQDLQEEFEQELEASKVKELAEFFAKLNSEKYGCILDELLVIRKGVDQLRKSNYELPIEINGLLIMVKKLIQFVRDSHIEPMMKINSIREVIAADVEFFNYEGSPFITAEEKKTVKVISPGWVYKDKELQISRPKVREEK